MVLVYMYIYIFMLKFFVEIQPTKKYPTTNSTQIDINFAVRCDRKLGFVAPKSFSLTTVELVYVSTKTTWQTADRQRCKREKVNQNKISPK